MRRVWVLIAVLLGGCGGDDPATVASAIPGATAFRSCAAAGDFWPTMTLALGGETAWVACKEESRVQSLEGAEMKLGGQAIAVLSAFDDVWALDDRGTLYRGEERIDLGASRPYNVWAGAGSVWAIDDGSGEVIRVDPERNEVVAEIAVGDGPSDMVFDEDAAWVINHRDRALVSLDTSTNTARRLATIADENVAPERMALLDGSLWITGRGADLLQVDPNTGRVRDTVEIGGSGIDVIAADGALWVPSRSVAGDQSGLPTMESLRRVTPGGTATTVAEPAQRVDVHGLTAGDGDLWLADNTAGIVYRLPLTG
jgi:streptogramin lyase